MNNKKYLELIEDLFIVLTKECELKINNDLSIEEKRKMIDMLSVVCPVGVLDDIFFEKQAQLLKYENGSRKVIDETEIKYKNKQAVVNRDLFNLSADLCVVFSKSLVCGYSEDLNNIDNMLVIKGGVEINEDYFKLLKENQYLTIKNIPYIVSTNNLSFNKLAKVLIKDFNVFNEDDLKDLSIAIEKVFDYVKVNKLKNVVFNFTNLENKENVKIIKNIINNIKNNKKYKNLMIFNENI